MEFQVERATFTEAVAWAARALPTRTPVPVLGGLLLETGGGRLTVSGFDFEASNWSELGFCALRGPLSVRCGSFRGAGRKDAHDRTATGVGGRDDE
jgi:hypothetical protein